LVQNEGHLELIRRIDYRTDPGLAPLADPNPIYAATDGPLRRPRPELTQPPSPLPEPAGRGDLLQFVSDLKR